MEESKIKNWVTTTPRFVVFLDIMGFKDFVNRNPHQIVYEKLQLLSHKRQAIDHASQKKYNRAYDNADIYTISFSDSFIMFSKDDSVGCFEIISFAAALLVQEAITNNIPIKGGIAHGQITVNKSQQIYFGQPIIDAFEIQEDVYYYGIVAHHTVNNFISLNEKTISPWSLNVLYKEVPTPLKSGKIKHHNINWFEFLYGLSGRNKEKALIMSEYSRVIQSLKNKTSGAPRRYIDNTEEVFHSMYPENQ